ncbi:hypothetical protein BCR34DRAFT_476214 [Clohesyomyces aquaticus]|uniref:Uncharacterized protein n=1 Tax=Clohesyomyces aquaticus TaxID=1231657 RepID=A0A1Y2A2A4_9PLEO|nr:hypothetical protein BCR34DRAFT_476214 [Clohesyomyces aquaticus]
MKTPVANADETPPRTEEDPIATANRILTKDAKSDPAVAKKLILAHLQEPEYTARDAEIRDSVWKIMDLMEQLAKKFFKFPFPETSANMSKLRTMFRSLAPETVKIIGSVASGGPGGDNAWYEFFTEEQKRRALVIAIIGNVVVEQVFEHHFFGGGKEAKGELTETQKKYRKDDGFVRNTKYAEIISRYLRAVDDPKTTKPNSLPLPADFHRYTQHIALAIYTHLSPILSLHWKMPSSSRSRSSSSSSPPLEYQTLLKDLYTLTTRAGALSIQMRIDPHTAYHFTPMFKEDRFLPKFADCFNISRLQAAHPRNPAKVWPDNFSEQEIRKRKLDDAVICVTMMSGVTAYRKGGWEAKDSRVGLVRYEGKDGTEKGLRSRCLTQGWVYVRWGRGRKWEKGVEVTKKEDYGMLWDGGFVEFRDLVERCKKGKGRA